MITRLVSGSVIDIFGNPVIGATLYLNGDDEWTSYTAATDLRGRWSIYLAEGWTGTVSVGKDGYSFDPESTDLGPVADAVSDIDFVGTVTENYFVVAWTPPGAGGVPGRTQAWSLTVEITEAHGIEKELFLMHRHTFDPTDPDNTPADYFVAICSPTDIEEYPINEPDPDSVPQPRYRVSQIVLYFRCMDLLVETMEAMQEDFRELERTMRVLARSGEPTYDVHAFGE